MPLRPLASGRDVVLIDMPPKKEVVVYTPMSRLQRDYYLLATEGKLRDRLLAMGLSGGRDCSQVGGWVGRSVGGRVCPEVVDRCALEW